MNNDATATVAKEWERNREKYREESESLVGQYEEARAAADGQRMRRILPALHKLAVAYRHACGTHLRVGRWIYQPIGTDDVIRSNWAEPTAYRVLSPRKPDPVGTSK